MNLDAMIGCGPKFMCRTMFWISQIGYTTNEMKKKIKKKLMHIWASLNVKNQGLDFIENAEILIV